MRHRSTLVALLAGLLTFILALPIGAAAGETGVGRYIVVLEDGVGRPGAVAAEHARRYGLELGFVYSHALNGYSAVIPDARVTEVRADDRVLFLSEDREVGITAQTMPTGIDRIDAELSSAITGETETQGINVAVIDTGIAVAHPDLNVVGGRNCSSGRSFDDGHGHGTHVAGTIAAKDDSNGVVGVVPGARLFAVRVLNNAGSGSTSSVVCGIDWVTSTRTDSDSTNNIVVANMSLGGGGSDDGNCGKTNNDAEHKAICASVAAGVTYVVAAGNDGADFRNQVPATYDEVLTVTAVADFNGEPGGLAPATCRSDLDDTYANFSNFATLTTDQGHTIAAPGVCIYSTWKRGGYNTISGTSMASPHVAGIAALCIASGACTDPATETPLTPAQIIQKLRADAETYNAANAGYGFDGDPLRPASGRYFGYLTRASY
jgi:subtilisin